MKNLINLIGYLTSTIIMIISSLPLFIINNQITILMTISCVIIFVKMAKYRKNFAKNINFKPQLSNNSKAIIMIMISLLFRLVSIMAIMLLFIINYTPSLMVMISCIVVSIFTARYSKIAFKNAKALYTPTTTFVKI